MPHGLAYYLPHLNVEYTLLLHFCLAMLIEIKFFFAEFGMLVGLAFKSPCQYWYILLCFRGRAHIT